MKPLFTATLLIAGIAYAQDGAITAWGWNEYGQCDVPEPNEGFVSIAGAGTA